MAPSLKHFGLQLPNSQRYSRLQPSFNPNEFDFYSSPSSPRNLPSRPPYENCPRGKQTCNVSFKGPIHCSQTWRANGNLKVPVHDESISSSNGSCCSAAKHVAIVWFKQDLRVDDHPGLIASSSYRSVVPVYIFDPEILASWPIHLLEALLEAVTDLRHALQRIGSDLIVRRGRIKDELRRLAQEVRATDVITEQDIEYEWDDRLQMTLHVDQETLLNMKCWRGPLYEIEYTDLPTSYLEFQKMRCPVNPPLEAPLSLPTLPGIIDRGVLPSVIDLGEDAERSLAMSCCQAGFKSFQKESAENLLGLAEVRCDESDIEGTRGPKGPFRSFFVWRERYILASPYEALEKRKKELMTSLDNAEARNNKRAGASTAMDALNGYLRFLEPTSRSDWKQLYEQVSRAETKRGTSFRSIFGNALTLGSLSHRRVYYEALEYEKARCGGRLSPFGYSSFTVTAAVADIQSMEWYEMLATISLEESGRKGWSVRYWRWRGYLIQFNTSGSEGPPVVFVHGFGAFGEHYRDNIKGLAAKGNRVWALTLLGFGRSEKPNVLYTELLWAELIRDFILEVVHEPVVLVGNSIGGYMVSSVAGLWPSLAKSLVLLNTAGAVVPDYLSLKYMKPREKSGFAWAGGRLILPYLRIICNSLLKKCYPKRPWRANNWLLAEVMRASHDPGAVAVLESLFYLKRPLPINYFIDRYTNKVLVIQGVNDPLSRFTNRARMLESHCQNIIIKLMDAGHCPHDEFPDEFNSLIVEWLQNLGLLQEQSDERAVTQKVIVSNR